MTTYQSPPTTTAINTTAQDSTTPLKRAPNSSSSRVSGVASPITTPDLKLPKPSSPRSGTASSYTPTNNTALVEYDITNDINSNAFSKPHNTTTALPPHDPSIQHTIEVSLVFF